MSVSLLPYRSRRKTFPSPVPPCAPKLENLTRCTRLINLQLVPTGPLIFEGVALTPTRDHGVDGPYTYSKLCFDPVCAAPALDHSTHHTVVAEGCAAGGALGSVCRVTCMAGFEPRDETEGRCTATGGGLDGGLGAAYRGQNVTCEPERAADGTMSKAYCRLATTEVILDCCDLLSGDGQPASGSCSRESPPGTCPLQCAERWLPLAEDCEQHLGEFGGLSAACESVAGEFLSMAPSSLELSGLVCHPDANGVYSLQHDTIGGKPHWQMQSSDDQSFHFFAINEPHNGWVCGDNLHSHFLIIESYEKPPPWGRHEWREVCAHQTTEERAVLLEPAFTMGECEEELRLLTPEMTEFCCEEGGPTFEQLLASDTSLTDCPYDCAHRWFLYSEECGEYLASRHPGLAAFTTVCASTHAAMAVISPVDGHLELGAEDEHFFSSQQGLVYEIEEVPGEGLQRSELAVEAPGTHHVLADRLDLTKQGAGPHTIEWYAAQTELGVDIAVAALEGEGDYHLEANIVGTAARLAPEAIVYSHNSSGVREVLLQRQCRFFDDCTYWYHGVEMRGDGSSYELRFHPTAGMTYSFRVHLKDGSDATHIGFAIFPPDSIASQADGSEATVDMAAMFGGGGDGGGCELPPLLQRADDPNPNIVDLQMGSFSGPVGGRPSWGDLKCQEQQQVGAESSRCCEEPTRVGPPEQPCGGTYRHFPGQTFDAVQEWEWTAPSTGEFLLKVTSNCDVPFYADPTQPGCQTTADGITCRETAVERCASAVGMTIVTVDRAVHVKHRFDIPLPPDASEEQRTLLASMFQSSQAPAMTFPTKHIPLDCNNPEQAADRPLCAEFLQRQQAAAGGGHRRELQELGCPHSTFLQREETMLTACGLPSTATDIDTIQLPYDCPSIECAEELVQLLDDCSESIHSLPDAALYQALEQSSMLVDCEELDQQAANFATVEVEFHAPSLAIANGLIAEHEELSAQLSSMFSQPGCNSGSSGRRLGATDEADLTEESELVADLRRQLRERDAMIKEKDTRFKKALKEKDAVVKRKDVVIKEKDAVIEIQAAQIYELQHHVAGFVGSPTEDPGPVRRASESTIDTSAGEPHHRQLQDVDCVADAMTMQAACCDAAHVDGDGCSGFPTACSSACAPTFFAYDAVCQLFVRGLNEAQRTGFDGLRAACEARATEAGLMGVSAAFDVSTEGGAMTACLLRPCAVEGVCLNGGSCVAEAGSEFHCVCGGGWNGTRCETW
eukprot:SAG22_NODE_5_length_41775_cov_111.520971_1_plen_1241_part_00